MKTRILVTGHSGFIGRNMTSWLHSNGYAVDGWDFESGTLPNVEQYNWVIHLGAVADPFCRDVDLAIERNFDFSQQLFTACNQAGTNFQYASSSAVYGNARSFTETGSCYPETPYAWSKYLFDRWVFQQPLAVMVQGFRYFDVYGKWQHLKGTSANFMHRCLAAARQDRVILVPENAEHVRRDWVWVGDVCRLHTQFLETVVGSGIWNVGSGLSHSLLDIAETVAEQTGSGISVVPGSDLQIVETVSQCADLKHLKTTVGKQQWLNVYEWLETEDSRPLDS